MFRSRSLGLVVLFVVACKDEVVTAPVRLDERLGAGQARAGRIEDQGALLRGPWAKGRIGDFKIYNDRVAVIVAAPETGRGFAPHGGGVVDADVIRAEGAASATAFGEVLIAFDFVTHRPESVEVVDDGSSGKEARLRLKGDADVLPLFDALLGSLLPMSPEALEWTIDYVLEPGADHLRIEHTLKNVSTTDLELGVIGGFFFGTGARPVLEPGGFSSSSSGSGTPYYAAASDEVSYIYTSTDREVAIIFGESGLVVSTLGDSLALRAREQKTIVDQLIIGGDDLSATRSRWRALRGEAAATAVRGTVRDSSGAPVVGARVHVTRGEAPRNDGPYVTQTKSRADGVFALELEPGRYVLQVGADDRRTSEPQTFDVGAAAVEAVALELPALGTLGYALRDTNGAALPAKLSIERTDAPVVRLPRAFGEADNGDGLYTLEFGITGSGEVGLPAGTYRVTASRGGEYEIAMETLTISAGTDTPFFATLARAIDSPGWMTSDTHIHARLSPDSPDTEALKVRAMVVENLELPVSTEHDAIADFNPAIRAYGLEAFMRGIVGSEITTTRYGHFNAFPLIADPLRPFNGRIDWYGKDPAGFFLAAHQSPGSPVVQINHPRSTTIGYFHHMDFDRETFEARSPEMSFDFDGIEVLNACGTTPDKNREEILDWFAFLNRGRRVFATAALDDHNGGRGEMGYPITYVRTSASQPADVTDDDFRAAFQNGRLIMSCGPFITLTVGAAEIGDTITLTDGRIEAHVTAQAPSWMDLDELDLVINGEYRARTALPASTSPLRFDGTLTATIAPGRDAWIALWAHGDTPHGIWAQHRPSFALTNPIFIDGNNDGRWSP